MTTDDADLAAELEELADRITDAANGPAEVETDAGKVKQQPIPDLIELARYKTAQAALNGGRSAWGATRPARLVPPDAVGPRNTESS